MSESVEINLIKIYNRILFVEIIHPFIKAIYGYQHPFLTNQMDLSTFSTGFSTVINCKVE